MLLRFLARMFIHTEPCTTLSRTRVIILIHINWLDHLTVNDAVYLRGSERRQAQRGM